MSQIYEAVKRVDAIISRKKLDLFRTRGLISVRTGFLLGNVGPETPDSEERLTRLRGAVQEILGERV